MKSMKRGGEVGIKEGKKEGRKKGRKEGRKEGREGGRKEECQALSSGDSSSWEWPPPHLTHLHCPDISGTQDIRQEQRAP